MSWGVGDGVKRLLRFLCDHRAHDGGVHFLALILRSSERFTSPQNSAFRRAAKLSSPGTRSAAWCSPGEGMSLLPVCCHIHPSPAGAGQSSRALTCINTCRRRGGNKAIPALPAAPAAGETPGEPGHPLPPPPRPPQGWRVWSYKSPNNTGLATERVFALNAES